MPFLQRSLRSPQTSLSHITTMPPNPNPITSLIPKLVSLILLQLPTNPNKRGSMWLMPVTDVTRYMRSATHPIQVRFHAQHAGGWVDHVCLTECPRIVTGRSPWGSSRAVGRFSTGTESFTSIASTIGIWYTGTIRPKRWILFV